MTIFNIPNGPVSFVERINWKAVTFKKVTADDSNIRVAYKVLINGKVIGAIGKLRKSAMRARDWVWVRNNESFKGFHYDRLSYSRQWAVAEMLHSIHGDQVTS
jgi:hypothetical protein